MNRNVLSKAFVDSVMKLEVAIKTKVDMGRLSY